MVMGTLKMETFSKEDVWIARGKEERGNRKRQNGEGVGET